MRAEAERWAAAQRSVAGVAAVPRAAPLALRPPAIAQIVPIHSSGAARLPVTGGCLSEATNPSSLPAASAGTMAACGSAMAMRCQSAGPARGPRATHSSSLGGPRLPVRPAVRPAALVRRQWVARSSSGDAEAAPGGSPPTGGSTGGSGGGGGDGEGNSGAAAGGAMLAGRALESLPAEMAEALKAGQLPQEMLQRFLDMDKNPIFSWLLKIGCAWVAGLHARLLADVGYGLGLMELPRWQSWLGLAGRRLSCGTVADVRQRHGVTSREPQRLAHPVDRHHAAAP